MMTDQRLMRRVNHLLLKHRQPVKDIYNRLSGCLCFYSVQNSELSGGFLGMGGGIAADFAMIGVGFAMGANDFGGLAAATGGDGEGDEGSVCETPLNIGGGAEAEETKEDVLFL